MKNNTKTTAKKTAAATKAKAAKPAAKKAAAKKTAAKKPAAKKTAAKKEATRDARELTGLDKKAATPTPAVAPATKVAKPEPKPVAKPLAKKEVAAIVAAEHEKALEAGTLVGGAGEAAVPLIRKSLVQSPVHAAWDMFDNLREKAEKKGDKLRRKDAIAAAVNSGIAFYTARTQYQSWKTANKY